MLVQRLKLVTAVQPLIRLPPLVRLPPSPLVRPLRSFVSRSTTMSALSAPSSAAPAAPEPSSYIDPDTPFYSVQPTAEIAAVYEKESARIVEALGEALRAGPMHMGSSAIRGMPGSPIVDVVVAVDQLPPPPEAIAALELAGYAYRGPAPHDSEDHWAMGGDGAKGHLGRVVLHITIPDSRFLRGARAFVDYCNSADGKEAFDAYAAVKIEGAALAGEQSAPGKGQGKDPRHITYKMHKGRVVQQVLAEAKAWQQAQEEGTPWTDADKKEAMDGAGQGKGKGK